MRDFNKVGNGNVCLLLNFGKVFSKSGYLVKREND